MGSLLCCCVDVERALREQISRLRGENHEMEVTIQDKNREIAMAHQNVERAERKLRDLQAKFDELKKDHENAVKLVMEHNAAKEYQDTEKLQNQNEMMQKMKQEMETLTEQVSIQRTNTTTSPTATTVPNQIIQQGVPASLNLNRKNPFDSDVEDGFDLNNQNANHQLMIIDSPSAQAKSNLVQPPIADTNLGFEDDFMKSPPANAQQSIDFTLIDIGDASEDIKERYLADSLVKIQEIKKKTDILKVQVDAFKGTNQDKVYLDLEEMLIRNLIALDKIETNDMEKIREERKNVLEYNQKCLEVLKNGVSQRLS